jgi:hypothetical protein
MGGSILNATLPPKSFPAVRALRRFTRVETTGLRHPILYYVLMPPVPPDHDDPPPFLGTWRRVYTAILIYLGAIIAASYLFTRAYR